MGRVQKSSCEGELGLDLLAPNVVHFSSIIVTVVYYVYSENSRDHDRQDHITQYESDDVAEHQAVTTTTTYHSQQAVMASRLP